MKYSWVQTSSRLPTDEEHEKCSGKYLLSDGFRVSIGTYNKASRKFGMKVTYKDKTVFEPNESAVYWQAILLPER